MSAEFPVVTLWSFRWRWWWTWSWTRLLLAGVRWTAFPRLQGRDLFWMFVWSTSEYLIFFMCGRLFERGHGLSLCCLCNCINSSTAFSEETWWQFSWFTFFLRTKIFFQYFMTDLDSVVIHNNIEFTTTENSRFCSWLKKKIFSQEWSKVMNQIPPMHWPSCQLCTSWLTTNKSPTHQLINNHENKYFHFNVMVTQSRECNVNY